MEKARTREVFAVAEFRALWSAYALSVAGDQLARVALSVLVFDRTDSPAWTALSYALTFLPDLIGGPLLSGIADRYSRRAVMVGTDLIRAVLIALMAVPGLPLPAVVALLAVAQLLASPFTAARSALLPSVLAGDRLVVGTALMGTTYQIALVAGFGAGAAVVAGLGVTGALLVDVGTFVVSALLVGTLVGAHRPIARRRPRWLRQLRTGFGVVAHEPELRSLVALACVSGAYVVPEGLAVPYATQLHGGTVAVGLLLAANPAGTVVGVLTLKGLAPPVRARLLGPLALLSCLVLVPSLLAPPLAFSLLLWFASGLCSAYNTIANALFVRAAPDEQRGQAVGLAASALRVAQGAGVVAAGLLAQELTPATVIAVAGVVGAVLAVLASRSWHRARASSDRIGDDSR